METKIPTGFFTVLFFFAIANMSRYPTLTCECSCKNMSPPPPSPPPPSPPSPSEICKPGDIHNVILCGPTSVCDCCTNWCNNKCRGMGSSVTNQKCTKFINSEGYPTTTCDCFCKNMSPPPSSPPPPSPSPPPPSPPPPQPFCCPTEMDFQVSPDQAPCKYTLSPSITTSINE
ncbi:hypothetical protein MKX03_008115 [Papaver bracteatum]|nr:hypothetical protein MKX03_008115 [Papaver bracteatum]